MESPVRVHKGFLRLASVRLDTRGVGLYFVRETAFQYPFGAGGGPVQQRFTAAGAKPDTNGEADDLRRL